MPARQLRWKRRNDEGLIGEDPFHDLTAVQTQSQRSASHLPIQNIRNSHTPAETPAFKRDLNGGAYRELLGIHEWADR